MESESLTTSGLIRFLCASCVDLAVHGGMGSAYMLGLFRAARTAPEASSPHHWFPISIADEDRSIAHEYVWAALDCPTGYACTGARHLGIDGDEMVLLGRMAARVDDRPLGGERFVITAWTTGRDGRKLYAWGALSGHDGRLLAVARTTWLVIDRAG